MVNRMKAIPPDVRRLLAWGDGVFSVADAHRQGVSRDRIVRLVKAGLLVRLARGAYAAAEAYASATEWQAFALRSRAFALACGSEAVVAGWSAVAVRGLPTIGSPPELPLVYVPADARASHDSMFGRVRAVALPRDQRVLLKSVQATSVARTVVDVGRRAPRDEALVVADAALARYVSVEELRRMLVFQSGWPGIGDAAWIVAHADGYAETPLETLGRLAFIEDDLPVPVSNTWVELDRRRFRLDHLLARRWLAFEGDGGDKYNNRLDAGRVVKREREREGLLRDAGLHVVRYEWEPARYNRRLLAYRFRSAIAAAPERSEPFPWWRQPIDPDGWAER